MTLTNKEKITDNIVIGDFKIFEKAIEFLQ